MAAGVATGRLPFFDKHLIRGRVEVRTAPSCQKKGWPQPAIRR